MPRALRKRSLQTVRTSIARRRDKDTAICPGERDKRAKGLQPAWGVGDFRTVFLNWNWIWEIQGAAHRGWHAWKLGYQQ